MTLQISSKASRNGGVSICERKFLQLVFGSEWVKRTLFFSIIFSLKTCSNWVALIPNVCELILCKLIKVLMPRNLVGGLGNLMEEMAATYCNFHRHRRAVILYRTNGITTWEGEGSYLDSSDNIIPRGSHPPPTSFPRIDMWAERPRFLNLVTQETRKEYTKA